YIALADGTGLAVHDLLAWALQPHIQQAIDLMQRARCEARRTEALDILPSLARESAAPVEKRRAATAVARIAHHPAPLPPPRHALANALALSPRGAAASLHALCELSSYGGRFQTSTPEDSTTIAGAARESRAASQAAFAAPRVPAGRQAAHQDVISIQKAG